MENSLKKREIIKILLLLVIPIVVYTFIMDVNINESDELINFQSVCKMVNGYTIYNDFNVIITPMFFYIAALIQKAFGNYLIAFRIYSIIMLYAFYIIFYLILKRFNIKDKVAMVGMLLIVTISMPQISNGANYNVLAVVFYLIGTLLAINEPSNKNSVLIGIMAYLTFATKQNVGAFFILAIIISELFCYRKKAIKNLIIQAVVCGILLGLNAIILLMQGNFKQFINYTFLGMQSFGQKNITVNSLKNTRNIIIYLGIIVVTILFFKKMVKEKKEEYYKLFIFALMLNFVVIPIINLYHIFLSTILTMVELLILLNKLFDKGCSDEDYEKRIKELHLMSIDKMLLIMDIILYFAIVLTVLNEFLVIKKPIVEKDSTSPYFLCIFEEDIKNSMENVLEYIKENDNTIIFSKDSCVYTPILKNNNGILDLPFNGNLGKESVSALIKEIDKLGNTKILMKEENFWQIPEEAIEYIKSNYHKDGEIEDYIIYSK